MRRDLLSSYPASAVLAKLEGGGEALRRWSLLPITSRGLSIVGLSGYHDTIMELVERIVFWAPVAVHGLGLVAILAAAWACYHWRDYPLITPGQIGVLILLAAATTLLGRRVMSVVRYKDTAQQIGIRVGMGLLGWALASLHLAIFDRLYLRRGRLSRIESLRAHQHGPGKASV